ncbi:MAG: hypothetical protein ABUT20_24745 [Bacteroidota bacterium]
MKDGKSTLLLLLAIGLVGTWIYHLYDKNQYSNKVNEVIVKDTTGIAAAITDSLQRLYASRVNEMGDRIDTANANVDSLKGQLDSRLQEISNLRNEISKILGRKNITKDVLKEARGKIQEMQAKVDEMNAQNMSLEEERKKLNGDLNMLTDQMKGLQDNISKLDSQNRELRELVNSASTLGATDLKLMIVDASSGDSEKETSKARKANKVVVSFIAQNNIAQFANTEVVVVLTAPDGSVITNAIWESGSFDTKKEKGKTFTRKIKFDYSKGEQKRLIFSLDYDKFSKGTYTLQLYHNGTLIGETSKALS